MATKTRLLLKLGTLLLGVLYMNDNFTSEFLFNDMCEQDIYIRGAPVLRSIWAGSSSPVLSKLILAKMVRATGPHRKSVQMHFLAKSLI
jgi:hypothetical protein